MRWRGAHRTIARDGGIHADVEWKTRRVWDAAQQELLEAGLTDGLPVVPPTSERVSAALDGVHKSPDESIATLPPGYEEVTWRDVAINAVMAGCAPSYLPVVGAAIAAMAAPEFNLLGIATTTGSATVCVIVNGPAANLITPGERLRTRPRANSHRPRVRLRCRTRRCALWREDLAPSAIPQICVLFLRERDRSPGIRCMLSRFIAMRASSRLESQGLEVATLSAPARPAQTYSSRSDHVHVSAQLSRGER